MKDNIFDLLSSMVMYLRSEEGIFFKREFWIFLVRCDNNVVFFFQKSPCYEMSRILLF